MRRATPRKVGRCRVIWSARAEWRTSPIDAAASPVRPAPSDTHLLIGRGEASFPDGTELVQKADGMHVDVRRRRLMSVPDISLPEQGAPHRRAASRPRPWFAIATL